MQAASEGWEACRAETTAEGIRLAVPGDEAGYRDALIEPKEGSAIMLRPATSWPGGRA